MDARSTSSSAPDRACRSCGVIAPLHGSDAECVAALQAQVEQLSIFVDSLDEQRARRSAILTTGTTTLQFPRLKRSA